MLNNTTTAELLFTRSDLSQVIAAQEAMVREGHACPKLGRYWDEFFAVDQELKSRGVK
jgi:hypothetical protein